MFSDQQQSATTQEKQDEHSESLRDCRPSKEVVRETGHQESYGSREWVLGTDSLKGGVNNVEREQAQEEVKIGVCHPRPQPEGR